LGTVPQEEKEARLVAELRAAREELARREEEGRRSQALEEIRRGEREEEEASRRQEQARSANTIFATNLICPAGRRTSGGWRRRGWS
jgi:hypothetical protein